MWFINHVSYWVLFRGRNLICSPSNRAISLSNFHSILEAHWYWRETFEYLNTFNSYETFENIRLREKNISTITRSDVVSSWNISIFIIILLSAPCSHVRDSLEHLFSHAQRAGAANICSSSCSYVRISEQMVPYISCMLPDSNRSKLRLTISCFTHRTVKKNSMIFPDRIDIKMIQL